MRFDKPSGLAFRCLAAASVLTPMLILSACAASQSGVSATDRSRYSAIAVVPRVNDRLLSVYWPNPLADPVVTEARMGWDAADGAGQISRDILGAAGALVSVTLDPRSAASSAADIAIVLEQAPLDQLGQCYNPGRDLFLSGISVAAAAAAGGLAVIYIEGKGNFKPRSVLRMSGGGTDSSIDADFCAVGLTPYLIDPTTGETLKKGRSLMGIEKIPMQLSATSWALFTPAERATVLVYCQAALRRAISQAFVELDVVD